MLAAGKGGRQGGEGGVEEGDAGSGFGLLGTGLYLGGEKGFFARYTGGYFVYQAEGPGEAASLGYYARGYNVY